MMRNHTYCSMAFATLANESENSIIACDTKTKHEKPLCKSGFSTASLGMSEMVAPGKGGSAHDAGSAGWLRSGDCGFFRPRFATRYDR
jgi:hypothetical protein